MGGKLDALVCGLMGITAFTLYQLFFQDAYLVYFGDTAQYMWMGNAVTYVIGLVSGWILLWALKQDNYKGEEAP